MLLTIVVFLIILTVLVLVHEAGHFFVAKRLGIKVEEFGFGLPPRAFSIKRGETIYSINWLPIGGFVKLYGEDAAGGGSIKRGLTEKEFKTGDKKRAFFARPAWQRALVVFAGVFMNFLLAVAILTYFFGIVGVQVPGDKVIVREVVKGSPAYAAGLKSGDIIREINGIKITSSSQLISITRSHLGEKINLKVEKQLDKTKTRNVQVIPRKNYPSNEGPIGIAISPNIINRKYPLIQAPIVGTVEAIKYSWLIILGLGSVVYQLFVNVQVPKGIAGPVGIAQLTGQFVQIGPMAVLSFVSLLSLNLAILNILPIPALDGGRLFFILIEAVFGRRVSPKFESYTHAIGMAILLALIILITLNDLIHIFTGQPILPKP